MLTVFFWHLLVFNTKLLHICGKIFIWCLFDAYSVRMNAHVCIWSQIAAYMVPVGERPLPPPMVFPGTRGGGGCLLADRGTTLGPDRNRHNRPAAACNWGTRRMLVFANVCIQHQICIYAAKFLFSAYLMLIRCLFLQMLGLNTKLLHICGKILIWCLFDFYSVRIFAHVPMFNCCIYAAKFLFAAF